MGRFSSVKSWAHNLKVGENCVHGKAAVHVPANVQGVIFLRKVATHVAAAVVRRVRMGKSSLAIVTAMPTAVIVNRERILRVGYVRAAPVGNSARCAVGNALSASTAPPAR